MWLPKISRCLQGVYRVEVSAQVFYPFETTRNRSPQSEVEKERGLSMNSRMLRILAMVIAAPATLAFATDSADPQSTTILHSSPTAAEFRPMTPRERLRDYLISLVNAESIVVTAASA